MKKVNFITTLSPEKQYAIKRWFLVTFFLIMCSLIASAYLVVPQLLTYIALHKQVAQLRVLTKEYDVQVKEKDSFGKFEPGNKVYYPEVDQYFNLQPVFRQKN